MNFNSVKNSVSSKYKSTKLTFKNAESSLATTYNSTKSSLISKLPSGIQSKVNSMVDRIPSTVASSTNMATAAAMTNTVPVDARSVLSGMLGGNSDVENANGSRDIITLSNLQQVSGMPTMGDNIVDPPVFIGSTDTAGEASFGRKNESAFSTTICGMDYVQRCIMDGQFLTLIPLKLTPNKLGVWSDKSSTVFRTLSSIESRLGIADYGLNVKTESARYWRTYAMLMKAASLSLGITKGDLAYSTSKLQELVPDYLYKTIIDDTTNVGLYRLNGKTRSEKDSDGTKSSDKDKKITKKKGDMLTGYASGNVTVTSIKDNDTEVDISSISPEGLLNSAGYSNFLKYTSNMEEGDLNSRLPIITFYVNGGVERNFGSTSNLTDSEVARATTDLFRNKVIKGITEELKSSAASESEAYTTELAYNNSLGSKISFALANTSIPKIISSTATNYSFTVKITEQSVGSDPVSLLRVQELYCRLVPFVTPISNGKYNTVVPMAPLYCAAFVKGVINIPRGAITSIDITTNPSFQTSEGIPTTMDATLTIQPLLTVSSIPNLGKYFNVSGNNAALIASMFNPMSSFNILATMCGYNTVLSKFPLSLFQYFIGGTVSQFVHSLKGTSTYLHSVGNDFLASRSLSFSQSLTVF